MRKSGLLTKAACICFCFLTGCGNANISEDADLLLHTVAINMVDVHVSADNSMNIAPELHATNTDNVDTISDIKSVSYNGVTFRLDDTSSSFVNKLGNTTAPIEKVGSCVVEGMAIRYSYGKMTLEFDEKTEKLNQVKIIDDGNATGKEAYVIGGIFFGCDESLVSAAIPQAKVNTIANMHTYKIEEPDASFEITCRDSKVIMISITTKINS